LSVRAVQRALIIILAANVVVVAVKIRDRAHRARVT
jgi:hypothetical protein